MLRKFFIVCMADLNKMKSIIYTATLTTLTALPAFAQGSYTENLIAELESRMVEVEEPADLEERKVQLEISLEEASGKLDAYKVRKEQAWEALNECDPDLAVRVKDYDAMNLQTEILYAQPEDECYSQLREYGAARLEGIRITLNYWNDSLFYRNSVAEESMRAGIELLRESKSEIDQFAEDFISFKINDKFQETMEEYDQLNNKAIYWRKEAIDAGTQLDITCMGVNTLVGFDDAEDLVGLCFPENGM